VPIGGLPLEARERAPALRGFGFGVGAHGLTLPRAIIEPGDFVIGKIARLFELKGHEYLFAAAPAIVRAEPRVKFLLVGDGVLRGHFEQEAAK